MHSLWAITVVEDHPQKVAQLCDGCQLHNDLFLVLLLARQSSSWLLHSQVTAQGIVMA
jgi:hypothetical protein